MAIPNPNPNIADGIKCDNKTYSSNKIEALISTATELPIPEAGDEGKVLTVNSDHDGYELDTPVTIDDSASSETTVYSSNKVEELLNDSASQTLTYETTNTNFIFSRIGHVGQITVDVTSSTISLPTSWTSIGNIGAGFYTEGEGKIVIPVQLVNNIQLTFRINLATGEVEFCASTSSNIWVQGRGLYLI